MQRVFSMALAALIFAAVASLCLSAGHHMLLTQ